MFNPSRDEVRRFFVDAWRKHRQNEILSPIESQALGWVVQHPEYHADLEASDALTRDFTVESRRTNPFLHLSMHLAISEQVSIDQPRGIKQAYDQLASQVDRHYAAHELMECLGQVVWEAQRSGQALNSEAYLDLIRRRVSRD
jgi:hypothetical protein